MNDAGHFKGKGGVAVFIVFFIILLSGFGLYVLLKPPAELVEEPAEKDVLFPEVTVSHVSLPVHSIPGERTLTTISGNKE